MEIEQIELSDDPKKFFSEIVNKALEGKQSDFQFIRTLEEAKLVRLYKLGTNKVIKVFKQLHKTLAETYAKDVLAGKQKVEMLMSIKQFEVCHDYYKKEHDIAKDMLSEYKTYVSSGHIFDQLVFNGVRPEEDCVDFRKLPWSLF